MRIAAFAAALIAFTLPTMASAETGKTPAATDGGRGGLAVAASRGDADAQYQLGLTARKGRGVDAQKTAFSWFSLAAANGSAIAATEAAKACENGKGVRKDLELAGQWWYRAAKLGDTAARKRWTDLFVSGQIASVGGIDGAGWVAELADSGSKKAAIALAGAYEHGNGVAPSFSEAEKWYRNAALLHGDVEARFRLGRMLLAHPAVWRVPETEEWSTKDKDRNKPFGPVWMTTKPVDDGDKAVLLRPGIEAGAYWLALAANEGHAEAQYYLGKTLAEGFELKMDLPSAIGWLRAASAQNHPAATMLVAELTAKGQGFSTKDPIRAYALYDLAATLGQRGAAEARDTLGRSMGGRQLARARQLIQDLRDYR
ncbi:tetratricopeptide repeat protein [Magnetospirillum molischianum]|uniref:TPR repeat n=1 Tax=Magnetospirillum molischianum DSM 120 TaxID=1150626 RepID=H8FRK8_MAGML|nr:tetratricopeptide repeat protein [Magnetospirillum molischianum]CCG40996.1 TPR repeat [Magnetospirillum molischianum DSM 120]